LSVAAFQDEVMDALATAKRRDRSELEQELGAAGTECPFDSIYLLRVAIRVGRAHGITLKPSRAIEKSFKSVKGVAELLAGLDHGEEAA
jgi:hypothetical protein